MADEIMPEVGSNGSLGRRYGTHFLREGIRGGQSSEAL